MYIKRVRRPSMNTPQNLNDIVTIQNIDNEPHEVVYDKMSYGTIEAGQTRQLPMFLASHATKHIIDHILNKKSVMITNISERQKLAEKMLVNVQKVVVPAQKTEAELLKEKVNQLNQPSDLDVLMAKQEVSSAPTTPETPPSSPAPTPPIDLSIDQLKALLAEKEAKQEIATPPQAEVLESSEETKSIASEIIPDIDRDGIYKWAETELGITIYGDEKTKKSLDEKTVEEVKKELGYE